MSSPLVLSIQDISCFGSCSQTVALPILSACKVETAILPTAILSNHTAFKEFSILDLSDEIKKILRIWTRQGLKFSAIYSAYLANVEQIDLIKYIMSNFVKERAIKFVDPVMADSGKLYKGFNMDFVDKMKELCSLADIITPNITEACLLSSNEYREIHTKEYIEKIIEDLDKLGAKNIIIKGINFDDNNLGIVLSIKERDKRSIEYYFIDKIQRSLHGTGDCFASALLGKLLNGYSYFEAVDISARFVYKAIKETLENHTYGVNFERALDILIN